MFVQSLNSHLVTRGYLSHRYLAKIQVINFIHTVVYCVYRISVSGVD